MRTIFKLVLSAITSFLLVVGLAPMALAGGDPTTPPPATIVAKSSSSNTDEGTVKDSSVVTVTAEGVPIVAYILPGGTPKQQQKRCFRLKRAGVYKTNFRSSTGAILWKMKAYPKGYTFCGKGRKVIDPHCGNTVIIRKPKPKARPRPDVFVEVPEFSWQVTATATTVASAKASAEARCDANGASASASASGVGYASGSASAAASGSTQVEAAAAARAAAKAKAVALKFTLEAKALAEASAKASAAATAEAHCTAAPPPPPATPAPQLVEIDTINDVLVNNTRMITITGSTAPDHNGTLFCSAKNGGSITANKSQLVSGSFTKSVTYSAPSEVPSGGKDWVSCTLTQDDGQVAVITTNQFVITARPVTPA